MSSKREEKVAFERLKKAFPGVCVSLGCKHESWYEKPYYQVYAALPEGLITKGDTASEAVDLMIKRKEE